jgi:hypothetical protein
LVNAVTEGWNNPAAGTAADPPPHSVAAPALGRFVVIARDGLRLRAGPGLEFAVIKTLPTATTVTVVAFEGADNSWARVDLEGDGLVDGHAFAAFLQPADVNEHDEDGH